MGEQTFPDHVWIGIENERPDGSIYEYDPTGIRNDFTHEFMSVAEHEAALTVLREELAAVKAERDWYRIALDFYARADIYEERDYGGDLGMKIPVYWEDMKGWLAREALARGEKSDL